MNLDSKKISVILPFYDELNSLRQSVHDLFASTVSSEIEEVLLCQNGAVLSQEQITVLNELVTKYSKVYLYSTQACGMGEGYRLGVEHAKADWLLLSACDLPFGVSDIVAWKKVVERESIEFYIGSKWAKGSDASLYPMRRAILSKIFYYIRFILWMGRGPKDSQGTVLIKRELAKKFQTRIRSNNYLFTTEMIQLALQQKIKIKELPIQMVASAIEKESTIKPFRGGFAILIGFIFLLLRPKGKSES